jgi:hypothetical protein
MSDGLLFVHAPRMSAESFARVLFRNGSPAAVAAADLYAIICSYDLDPAVALAFFAHESTYGKYGVAARSLNWGNLRRGPRAYKVAGGFGYYHSWTDSLRDWCELITNRYVARGLVKVEQTIPVYAPSSDGNAPARYIAFVRRLVEGWEAAEPAGAGLGGGYADPPAQRIVAVNGARVRSTPEFGNNIVGSKAKGAVVGGLLVEGAEYQGSRQWLKLCEGQYMHASVLL